VTSSLLDDGLTPGSTGLSISQFKRLLSADGKVSNGSIRDVADRPQPEVAKCAAKRMFIGALDPKPDGQLRTEQVNNAEAPTGR